MDGEKKCTSCQTALGDTNTCVCEPSEVCLNCCAHDENCDCKCKEKVAATAQAPADEPAPADTPAEAPAEAPADGDSESTDPTPASA